MLEILISVSEGGAFRRGTYRESPGPFAAPSISFRDTRAKNAERLGQDARSLLLRE